MVMAFGHPLFRSWVVLHLTLIPRVVQMQYWHSFWCCRSSSHDLSITQWLIHTAFASWSEKLYLVIDDLWILRFAPFCYKMAPLRVPSCRLHTAVVSHAFNMNDGQVRRLAGSLFITVYPI